MGPIEAGPPGYPCFFKGTRPFVILQGESFRGCTRHLFFRTLRRSDLLQRCFNLLISNFAPPERSGEKYPPIPALILENSLGTRPGTRGVFFTRRLAPF
jgi:hypothetical protein